MRVAEFLRRGAPRGVADFSSNVLGVGFAATCFHSESPAGGGEQQQVEDQKREKLGLPTLAKSVGVKSRSQQEVDPVPRHANHGCPENTATGEAKVTDPADVATVQNDQVGQQRNECPDLLRVPPQKRPQETSAQSPPRIVPAASSSTATCIAL